MSKKTYRLSLPDSLQSDSTQIDNYAQDLIKRGNLEKVIAMILNMRSLSVAAIAAIAMSATASAQNFGNPANTTIQLPVVSFFNVRTVVSVPDAGIMKLGGVSRHASGRTTRGIPGLGRAFTNRSQGFSSSASNAHVKVRILSNREMSEDALATAERRAAFHESRDPNGTKSVQAKADFITRNVGRSKR